MKTKFKIDWECLWNKYERWFIRHHEDVSWQMQQKQIEKLVNKQVNDLKKQLQVDKFKKPIFWAKG